MPVMATSMAPTQIPERTLEVELRGVVGRLCDVLESQSPPPEVLIVGAAGTGKTWGILLLLHLLSLRQPDLRILVCRKTREALTESVLVSFEKEILPLTGHRLIAEGVQRRFRQAYSYPNGTQWIVGGLDRASKILSTSYDLVFANEAIELTEEDWETLQSRIGRPDRSHGLNCLIGDTNPGPPSHWLKERCEQGRTLEWVSRHVDNPAMWRRGSWTQKGSEYLDRLRLLTGTRRKRLLEGVWAAGEAQWFSRFDEANISELACYDPSLPVHLSIDSGVTTGAVAFQVCHGPGGHTVSVFADWLYEDISAERVARSLVGALRGRHGTKLRVSTDPAGGARNPVGPSVIAEYERSGLGGSRGIERWPNASVADTLALVESLVESADGERRLLIHPGCKHLISAFQNYQRASRAGQMMDYPMDPQHPAEDLIDALRGGLNLELPEGRIEPRQFQLTTAARLRY